MCNRNCVSSPLAASEINSQVYYFICGYSFENKEMVGHYLDSVDSPSPLYYRELLG